MSRPLATFRRLARSIEPESSGSEAAEKGRPVGYFCLYTPPEIILASGHLPFRLRATGSGDSSSGDAWMSGRVCTFVRHVMSLALDGKLDFLGGVVCANTCDHVRRAADLFAKKTRIPFTGFVSVPRNPRESLLTYYREELANLFGQLCALSGNRHEPKTEGAEDTRLLCEIAGDPPSDAALRSAIRELEAVRVRLRALNGFRSGVEPRLTGGDMLAVNLAAQTLHPPTFCALADELLGELETAEPLPTPRARLVLVGGELDDPAFVDTIESQGALVVDDLLCFGSRFALDPIDHGAADPLDAIARAYFFRTSCARMIGDFPRRWETLTDVVRRSRADGVVFQRLLFCDPWGADAHNIAGRVKGTGASCAADPREVAGRSMGSRVGSDVEHHDFDRYSESKSTPGDGGAEEVNGASLSFPVLFLSREYGVVPTGQLKTRVQAFVEKIEIARLQRSADRGAP